MNMVLKHLWFQSNCTQVTFCYQSCWKTMPENTENTFPMWHTILSVLFILGNACHNNTFWRTIFSSCVLAHMSKRPKGGFCLKYNIHLRTNYYITQLLCSLRKGCTWNRSEAGNVMLWRCCYGDRKIIVYGSTKHYTVGISIWVQSFSHYSRSRRITFLYSGNGRYRINPLKVFAELQSSAHSVQQRKIP